MSASRLDHLLSSLISILYLILLAALPLLFSMKSSEVFEFPKMLFVYAMTVLIVACWLARMIVNRRIIYEKTPLDIPIFLFLLSQLFSTLFSIDVHTSLFGYYSRWNGGLLSTIAYTMLYVAYVSNRRQATGDKQLAIGNSQSAIRSNTSRFTINDLRLTIYVILASAAIVSVYALLQRLGIDKDLWIQDVVSRVFSTQGQPNWLAAYLVMVMPVAWATGVTSYKLQVTSLKKYFWLVACSLLLIALFFTRSRSGLLGLAVADVVFWGVTLWTTRTKDEGQRPKKERFTDHGLRLTKSFFIVHCSLFILFLLTNNPAREWISRRIQYSVFSIQYSPSQSAIRYPLSTDSITPSSDIRRIVWVGALQLVKERPWFGWGPETFAYTYWKVRPVAHNMTSEWNFLYNKAHNEWLNLAANSGLIGLGSHLLLLGWFTVWVARQLNSSKYQVLSIKDSQNKSSLTTYYLLLTTTLSALWGVESVNFFGFSTVTTQTYSYIFMGIAVAGGIRAKGQGSSTLRGSDPNGLRETKNSLRVAKNELRIPFTVYCLLFTVFLATLYLLSQISISFLADLSYNRGKQFANAGYVQDALVDLESAVDLVPDEPVFRSELAEAQGVLAISLSTASSLKDASLTNFRIVGKQSPGNVSFLRTRARVTYALGSLDPSLYNQGIALMRHTMELAPTDPKIPYNLGIMFEDRGEIDETKLSFEKALELKPDYEEAKKTLESLSK